MYTCPGRIEEVAGGEIILKTAKLLEGKPNLRFLLLGEGDPKMLNELSSCTNVILAGRVPKETVPEYLAAADCILVPFPNSVASHAISPLKLFEALAMKKPVIASAISGIKEVALPEQNVLLVPNDPQTWAAALNELSGKTAELVRRGAYSRGYILQNYDFNHLAVIFENIVNEAF